jgi:hypothetical protein
MSQFITADKRRYAQTVAADLHTHFGARAFYSRAMVSDALRRLDVDPYFACWMYALFCPAHEFGQIDACSGLAWGYHELRSQMADILHALDEQKRGPPKEQFWLTLAACIIVLFLASAMLLIGHIDGRSRL